MYHSITFYDSEATIPFNTWDEWNLVPSTRPFFEPPKLRTQVIDVPTGTGSIDLSTSLTGYPLFENRTGSIEFIVINDTYEQYNLNIPYDWARVYSDIMKKVHGQYLRAVLEDDPDWYYEGRFTVDSWKSDKHYSLVTIGYDVNPYKWDKMVYEDTFTITSNDASGISRTYYRDDLGDCPVNPTITVDGATKGINVHINTPVLSLLKSKTFQNGSTKVPEFVLYTDPTKSNSRCYLDFTVVSGTSTADVTISYRRGKL